MNLRSKRIAFEILKWYGSHRRDLPWRRTTDPYRILISETMLQQTQVSRVLAKYPEFIERFPNLQSLARSSAGDVIRAWAGLGYNIRAIRLRKAAQLIISRFGKVPESAKHLRELPGIGRYSAHALSCFAHGRAVPVVETNVRRVLSRMFWRTSSSSFRQEENTIWRLAGSLLHRTRPVDWNLALMDLGAAVCTARAPRCPECPVNGHCRSAFRIRQESASFRRQEPMHQGRPRRYYRGRIIQVLRNVNHGGWISARRLGRLVKQDFGTKDLRWLAGVLRQLERDGLIVLHKPGRSTGLRLRLAS
ncbi:MAG TPA: A/G-specific adenine glycosylase [Bacteroidota bacterium]